MQNQVVPRGKKQTSADHPHPKPLSSQTKTEAQVPISHPWLLSSHQLLPHLSCRSSHSLQNPHPQTTPPTSQEPQHHQDAMLSLSLKKSSTPPSISMIPWLSSPFSNLGSPNSIKLQRNSPNYRDGKS
eukprot:TRINITY_DN2844_c1_g1_i4.p2 TRINITY_DN2844_c1_g1~~TRINITY_DN2844_c1_g1_i4.p2  ORF type:complete len:128 (-),score=30.10 TRINITY_DN2844_c1_g1_i4:162-545(-)